MLRAIGCTGSGQPLLVLGLSGENMARLMAQEPIITDTGKLGLPSMQILLVGGRDEKSIKTALQEGGFLTSDEKPPPRST